MAYPPPTEKEQKCVDALRTKFTQESLDPEDTHFFEGNTYLRFTRARDANVDKASEMLQKCIEWRKSYKPYAVTADDVAKVMTQNTMSVGGRCKEGYPVLGMTLAVPNECGTEERVKQLVYILEETQRKGYDHVTWIIDFSEMGKHPKDERSKETRKITSEITQNYYPERLGKMYLYKPPWYISSMLGVAKLFIDARTRKKIHKGGSTVEELEKFVARDQLPVCFGGTFEARGNESLALLKNFGVPDGADAEKPAEKTEEKSPAAEQLLEEHAAKQEGAPQEENKVPETDPKSG